MRRCTAADRCDEQADKEPRHMRKLRAGDDGRNRLAWEDSP
jgi:hypothetical protein